MRNLTSTDQQKSHATMHFNLKGFFLGGERQLPSRTLPYFVCFLFENMKILYGIIDKDKHKTPCLTEDNYITLYMDNKLVKLLSTKDEVATLLSMDDISFNIIIH